MDLVWAIQNPPSSTNTPDPAHHSATANCRLGRPAAVPGTNSTDRNAALLSGPSHTDAGPDCPAAAIAAAAGDGTGSVGKLEREMTVLPVMSYLLSLKTLSAVVTPGIYFIFLYSASKRRKRQ